MATRKGRKEKKITHVPTKASVVIFFFKKISTGFSVRKSSFTGNGARAIQFSNLLNSLRVN